MFGQEQPVPFHKHVTVLNYEKEKEKKKQGKEAFDLLLFKTLSNLEIFFSITLVSITWDCGAGVMATVSELRSVYQCALSV